MQMLKYFLFGGLLLLALACEKDKVVEGELSLDGPNVTGPILEPDYHELAAAFSSNQTAPYAGRQLERVSFFLGPRPTQLRLRIYGEGAAPNMPGAILYEIDLSNRLVENSWNEHRLTMPVEITGDDLWISIGLLHNRVQQSLGCDAGPNRSGGDWHFKAADQEWETFRARTGESINWNIRGYVSEE